MRVRTPIPKSTAEAIIRTLSGTPATVLWRLLVVAALLLVSYLLLVTGGAFAGIIGAAIILSLFNDDIRAFVGDVWNRNFWVWRS